MYKEITLAEIMGAVRKNKNVLTIIFIASIVLSCGYYLLAPKSYIADATLVVTAASPMSGLSNLMSLAGAGGLQGSTTNIIFAVLGSRTVASAVTAKMDIAEVILGKRQDQLDALERAKMIDLLREKTIKSYIGKNGAIKIEATLKDQNKVAALVNQYIDELY